MFASVWPDHNLITAVTPFVIAVGEALGQGGCLHC